MKLYSSLLVFLLFSTLSAMSQQEHRFSIAIDWKKVQDLRANDEVQRRLFFEGANYLDENQLPYFTYTIPISKEGALSTYTVALDNAVFTFSTEDETTVLSQLGVPIQTTIHIDYYIVYEKKQPSLQLLFTPIIQKENSYAKLIKADLIISSTPANKTGNQGKRSLGDEDQSIHQYASSSVLASGNWYQIRVPQTGIYKLTYEDLLSLGIQNPAQVRVFGYGGAILEEDFSIPRVADDLPEIALFMEKGSDDVFNAGDYILFHAQGTIRWQYDKYSGYYKHQQNYYATHGYYFVTERAGEGKRITSQPLVTETPVATVTDFLQYGVYEKEQVNLLESGREWYGDKFTNTNRTLTIPFSFPSVSTTKSAKIDVVVVGNSTQSSSISVHIDDVEQTNKISIFAITSYYQVARQGSGNYFSMPKGQNELNVKLTYIPQNTTAFAHLDFVRVNAYQALNMEGNSMYFRQTDQDLRDDVLQYELGNATSDIRIWDLSDPLNMVEIPTTFSTNTLFFVPSVRSDLLVREFLAIRTSATFPKPEVIGKIANQNLHAIQQADYVIISPNEFREQAMRLATFHQQKNGYSVVIVEPQQIYNEFSSGTPDATAYRWFLKMLYDRAGDNINNQPKALLFVGISSYDNRGIVHSKLPLLSYQSDNSIVSTSSYTTDDYYAFLDDSEGLNVSRDVMDIGVGRLPVATLSEAKIVVDKIVNYTNNTKKGLWKNYAVFLGDDGDGNIHMTQSDNLVQIFQEKSKAYQPAKVYLDAYQIVQSASGSTYPSVKERMLNIIKSGALIFNFVGHGSVNSLTEEQTIVRKDIENMRNDNLALWITATCDFSRYDNNKTSAGMNVLLNPYGGGIALLTTTRTVFSGENYRLSQQIYKNILPEDSFKPITLGEIMRRGKVGMGTDANKLNFALLGDPMLSLSYPTNRVITTQINDAVLPDIATIKSLSLVTIKGYIENNEQNGILEEFNGFIYVTVYDKEETIHTLSNRGNVPFTYKDRPNVIFSGKTTVVNGEFTILFMVPKDINYRYGDGRIVYYAVDETLNREANGYSEDLIVGGSSDDISTNQEGPIVRMYLNTPHFLSGQTVNNSPVFYAFMNDDFGINTVGAGIGHDIVLKLNNQTNYTYVLNDYYQATLDDYKSGYIRFPLNNLPAGSYELQFKVWNLQNISTTQTLYFTVEDTAKPSIYSFYAYPNPASVSTNFVLEHDRPDVLATATFIVCDITGRKVWQSQTVTILGDEPLQLTWDLTDSSGRKLPSGHYLMNVKIETPNEAFSTATQKIIIIGQ